MSKKIENQIIRTQISSGGYIEHNLAKKYAIIERFKYKDNNSLYEFSSCSHCIGKYKTLHSAIQAKQQFEKDENSRINKD